jgi:hypothetical protein
MDRVVGDGGEAEVVDCEQSFVLVVRVRVGFGKGVMTYSA